MPNPFPGVNPYIEAAGLWPGFHNLLVGDCSRLLNRVLKPRGYAAFVEERIELVDLPNGDEDRRPDVAVTLTGLPAVDGAAGGTPGPTAVLDAQPVTVTIPDYELLTVAFVEVRYLPGQELVTSIELLSPSNKGKSRGGYTAERRAVLATDVNLVEVDLLLGGRRPDVVGRMPPGDFCALVSRGDQRPKTQAYAWSVRQPLPPIAIPLRPCDPDAMLELGTAYSTTYEDGPYDVAGMYGRPISDHHLPAADLAWVAARGPAATGAR